MRSNRQRSCGATEPRPSQIVFAVMMIGLGVIGLIYGDFAMGWQGIPIQHLPGRLFFAYASAVVELLCGFGLLIPRTTPNLFANPFRLFAAVGGLVEDPTGGDDAEDGVYMARLR